MKNKAKETIELHQEELHSIAKSLFDHPEIGNEEIYASQFLSKYLLDQGFDVQEHYIVPTGFRATYDSKKPGRTVAILCEYDALPEIGHGCGHNLIAAIGVGAGLGIKSVIDEIGGRVVVLGTPAEENFGGKVSMVEGGCFDDIDFAMMVHPQALTILSTPTLALKPLKFEFFGKTAHASAQPEKGINALDAAVLAYININMLRQYLPSHARVHGIIREGGQAANIIPEYASLEYYFRGVNRAFVEDLADKATKAVEAACLTTGCTFKSTVYETQYDDLITNQTLLATYKKNLDDLGVECSTIDEGQGSTDMGNVSYVVPTIHPYIGIGGNVRGHSRELALQTISESGTRALLQASTCLAFTAIDVLSDAELFNSIQQEFSSSTK